MEYALYLTRRFDHAPGDGWLKMLALTVSALILTAMLVTPAWAQLPFSKSGSLVTVVPGIRDEASHSWLGAAATIAPMRERWVIREEGANPGTDLRNVPLNHIITLRTNDSPEHIKSALRMIARQKDVTVIVDVNIGWKVTESSWAPHTRWAAMVARTLAESHAEVFPNAQNLYIGHSAGTEPVAMMPPTVPDRRAGSIPGSERRLYDDIRVLSPRRSPDDPGYPKWAVLAFADGDFYSNIGHVGADPVRKTYGEREAIAFQRKGYSVMRMADGGYHGMINEILEWGRTHAHREVHDFSYPDRKMVYYHNIPGAPPILMPTTSMANALKFAVDVQAGRITHIPGALERIQLHEPTPGIGGISLNATAYMPLDPAEVDYAGYGTGESALFLRLKNGETLRLPAMDPEVLRQSYDVAYVEGKKAELSIGGNRATSPDGTQVLNLQAPGKFSVYYFGNIQDTLLGLVMYQVDDILGQLAFTTSDAVREVAKRIPNFRSLVELFPEKYASHPAQGNFSGVGGRIFLSPSMVELVHSSKGRGLEFGEFAFSVRFGQTGPAEAAFAAFFEANLLEILKTESGAAFAQLIPYARATAVFRWMRENNIRFVPGALERVATPKVFTPTSTAINQPPKYEEVVVQRPTIFFGLAGPTRIVRTDGGESTIAFHNGKVSEVRRYDGQMLRVFRDSLGVPLAVLWRGQNAIAFMDNPEVGLVLAKNVDLKTDANGLNVTLRRDSVLYPIVNPESVVSFYAIRFANGEVNL